EAHTGAFELFALVRGHAAGHHDHSVAAVQRDEGRPARRPGVVVADERDDRADAALGALRLDATQDLDGPGAVQPADDDVDEAGPARPPPTRGQVVVGL